jgi:two-component system CheB/CheR fusion protein
MLIGVTQFFRDAGAFGVLREQVVPNLLARARARHTVRVWVAGCATGEEAYSIAMAIAEEFRARNRVALFRVFATDVHGPSLDIASAGIYAAESVERVPQALREVYFRPHRDGFQVSPDLRSHVVFAHHNMLRDAPFTRLDIVSCRNVLIYLSAAMQRKALSAFHFALKTNGALILGPSESPSSLAEEFAVVDTRWKLFRKLRDVRIAPDLRSGLSFEAGTRVTIPRRPVEDARVGHCRELLLREYGPPSMLVDGDLRLLHAFNAASEFLTPKDGRPSLNLMDLVDGELKAVLAAAIRRAQRVGRWVGLVGFVVVSI